jgi:hypothetical protein
MNTAQKHLTAIVCVVLIMGVCLHLVGQTPEPKKMLAPDGVNWITENRDGTQSVTLMHVPNKDAPQFSTLEEFAKTRGKLVIDKVDADEVVKALEDSLYAANIAVGSLKALIEQGAASGNNGKIAEWKKQAEMNRDTARALLTKWRARADSLKEAK